MKKLIASMLAIVGLSAVVQAQPKVQTVDPKSILFTTPTLSSDIAALEPVHRESTGNDLLMHEDEWSQLEFLPKGQLEEVQRMLKEFKAFELAHRAQYGWTEVYVRRLKRSTVLPGIQQLEQVLGRKAGPAPLLYSSGGISGSVKNGFSLSLGGNVSLYGYADAQGIPVLGAYVGKDPDDLKLTQAFIKLNSSSGLILVDWRGQLVLTSVSPSGQVGVWRP
jgi:hypothetical protein